MYGQPVNWPRRLAILGVLVVAAGIVFRGPISRAFASRSFPVEVLRKYERLYGDERRGVRDDILPPRTGKVVVVQPSKQLIFRRGGGYPMPWTALNSRTRKKIQREIDPPSLHESWFELDGEIRARTPEEVDTVILCETRAVKDGVYVAVDSDTPGPAFAAQRQDSWLLVYDARSGRFLGEYHVQGTASPEETTVLGKHMGDRPDVAAVIERMALQR